MHVKVPDVQHCCFCLPLRYGIIVFAYINILFSVVSVTCLVITTELKPASMTRDASIEVMTSTVLFSILGMGVILNFLLLIAGYQKDISMLRLYNYYTLVVILAALVPTLFLLSKQMVLEAVIALFVIAMQTYVAVLVRSEIVKLEEKELHRAEEVEVHPADQVDVSDCITLV